MPKQEPERRLIGSEYEYRLPSREYLRHLSRHSSSIPELLDEECLRALGNVEAQYGDVQSYLAGLEVRLGSHTRTADYTLCTTDGSPFPDSAIWLEMDYDAFCRPGNIVPCLFLNTWAALEDDDPNQWWERALVAVAGEGRASRLRHGLIDIQERLPLGACVKQIGAMARPGEEKSLRVVLMFWDCALVPQTMEAIGWPGDAELLSDALAPYADMDRMGVNLDLSETGIRQPISIEIMPRWWHPVLVDRMVSRLERADLCLPQKGEALRRWVRIPPEVDPFIQTSISHYKLGYVDGGITEAKAYLQQTAYPVHRLYPKDQA